jgi:hypothetical protein
VVISAQLRKLALATTGFMPVDEGDALHEAALVAAHSLPGLPLLEVGSYCGRSTIWLGDAARQANTVLFAVDHHRGSEENQPGWEWHDETLVDPVVGRMDTLPFFRHAMFRADLEEHVLAVVGHWRFCSLTVAMVLNQHDLITNSGHHMLPSVAFWRFTMCFLIQPTAVVRRMNRFTCRPLIAVDSKTCQQQEACEYYAASNKKVLNRALS